MFVFIFTNATGQLLEENFNYSTALTANGWSQLLTTSTNPLTAGATGLTYSGYASSGIGNAVTMATSGQDVTKGGWTTISSGNLYLSAMINVSSATAATGDYFLGFYSNGATRLSLHAKSVAGGFNLGIVKGSTTPAAVYSSTVFTLDAPHLIVLKYTFNAGTTTDDVVSLFVDPTVNGVENGIQLSNITGTATDITTSQSVIIRQGTAGSAPALTIDGIRVGATWAEILSPPLASFYYNGTGDLKDLNSWGTATNGSGTPPSSFTSASQSFNIANTTNAVLTGSWTVSGLGSKIIVPALDTLTAIGGATINASTIDIAATGAFQTDNFTFPTWGSVAGSVLLNNASGFNVSPGPATTITIPNFLAGGDFIVLNGNVNMNDNALTVAGKLQINGSNKITGTDVFTLNSTGTLRIGHPEGITANQSTFTGAIQMSFARNFDPAASYTYIGTGTNLVTGDGLPTAVSGTGALTIKLTSAADIIELTQSITGNAPTISLLKGKLRLGNNNITLGSMVNGGDSSYVITDGTGTISRQILSTGGSSSNAKNFYMGTATQYRGLSITFPKTIGTNIGGSTVLTVGYKNADPGSNGYPSGIVAHSTTGYWTLAMSVKPDSIFTLVVNTAGMAAGPGANFIKRTSGANEAWVLNGGVAAAASTTLTETGCSLLSAAAPVSLDIALGYSGALPVNLLSFSGNVQKEGVQLNWQVTNENAIEKYEIEKSSDGSNFKVIGTLSSVNTGGAQTYNLLDKTANESVSYYRLRIIDQNNLIKYSTILKFDFKGAIAVNVSPNPVLDGRLNLRMYGQAAGVYAMRLFDATGRQVYAGSFTHAGGSAIRTIDLNNKVKSGLHYLVIDSPSQEKKTLKINIIQ
jgi:hypothetical protein